MWVTWACYGVWEYEPEFYLWDIIEKDMRA